MTDTASAPATMIIDRSWWSWGGAHGGYLAATALAAMRAGLDEPRPVRSLSTHFLAPVDERPFALVPSVDRAGRRASVATCVGTQDGTPAVLASAVFGPGAAGPGYHGLPAPAVPGVDDCPTVSSQGELVPFANRLRIRAATEARPFAGGEIAELVAWMSFADGTPLDADAITVLLDAPPPALYAVWTAPRPVPTTQLTVHFTDALDAGPAGEWALVRIRTEHAGSGWSIDDSAVWTVDGRLVATGRQSRRILGELN